MDYKLYIYIVRDIACFVNGRNFPISFLSGWIFFFFLFFVFRSSNFKVFRIILDETTLFVCFKYEKKFSVSFARKEINPCFSFFLSRVTNEDLRNRFVLVKRNLISR